MSAYRKVTNWLWTVGTIAALWYWVDASVSVRVALILVTLLIYLLCVASGPDARLLEQVEELESELHDIRDKGFDVELRFQSLEKKLVALSGQEH